MTVVVLNPFANFKWPVQIVGRSVVIITRIQLAALPFRFGSMCLANKKIGWHVLHACRLAGRARWLCCIVTWLNRCWPPVPLIRRRSWVRFERWPPISIDCRSSGRVSHIFFCQSSTSSSFNQCEVCVYRKDDRIFCSPDHSGSTHIGQCWSIRVGPCFCKFIESR